MNTTALRQPVSWAKSSPQALPLRRYPLARRDYDSPQPLSHPRAQATLARLGAQTVANERRFEGLAMGLIALSGLLCLTLAFEVGALFTEYFSTFSAWITHVVY